MNASPELKLSAINTLIVQWLVVQKAGTGGDFTERDPNGIRTRVTAVKGRCPGPLDDRVVEPAISISTPPVQAIWPRSLLLALALTLAPALTRLVVRKPSGSKSTSTSCEQKYVNLTSKWCKVLQCQPLRLNPESSNDNNPESWDCSGSAAIGDWDADPVRSNGPS